MQEYAGCRRLGNTYIHKYIPECDLEYMISAWMIMRVAGLRNGWLICPFLFPSSNDFLIVVLTNVYNFSHLLYFLISVHG